MLSRRALVMTCLLLAAGCQDDVATPFPAGLEPLEANQVPDATGAPVEELRTWSSDGSVKTAHGRAFVFASPAALWAVMKTPEVMIARCSTDERTFVASNDPAYEFSFLASYTVHMVLAVQWDDQWRFGVVEGTPEAPALGMARHQKVQGSDFISLSTGTVQLRATDDPAISEVAFVEQLDAVGGNAGDLIVGMQDNYNRMRAALRGEPLPPCP